MSKKKVRGVDQLDSGRWRVRINVEGRQVTVGTYRSQAEAKAARDTEEAKVKLGQWVDPAGPRVTVAQWAEQWLELRNKGHADRRTRSFLRAHILPTFGDRRLGDVTPVDVRLWVIDLEGKGLAPNTVRSLYATLKAMFAMAVEYDKLTKTPCRSVEVPKKTKPDPVVLDVETLLLLEKAITPQYAAMVHLGAWTGMRWGEIAALRWENVDLEQGVIHVREAVKSEGKQIGLPKGDKTRVVHLAPSSVEVLRRHRRDFGFTDLLFTGPKLARQIDYSSFRRRVWVPTVRELGLDERLTFHKLRHAYAALMRPHVAADVLTAEMGHHSEDFNVKTYGYVRPDHGAVVADAIERVMSGG